MTKIKNSKYGFRILNIRILSLFRISDFGFRIFQEEKGYAALTVAFIVMAVSLTIIGGFAFFSLQEIQINRAFRKSVEARFVAEAGIEDAAYRVVANKQIGVLEEIGVGQGTTTISVVMTGGTRTIRSEGKKENSQQNMQMRIESYTAPASFWYGAQVGDGGLEIGQNATVRGSVFSNGPVVGDNGAAITGDAIAASTSSITKVTIGGNAQANLITDSTIGGYASSTTKLDKIVVGKDAHANELVDTAVTHNAYYMIIDSKSTVLGTRFSGNPGPPAINLKSLPLSASVIDQFKSGAQSAGIIASGTCAQNWSPPTNPYTMNGGMLEQNLILDNNQVLILKGNIWVKCNVDISNGARIQLDPIYGSMSGAVIADGWIHLQNNGAFQGSGIPGSYLMLLTTATGGGHHGSAIDLHNNAGGAIFYASNGMVYLHNNVTVTELVGAKVHLENNATLIYEIGLQNMQFSGGSSGGYDVKEWKAVE